MATYTDNIGLKKPDGIDQVMVKDLNDNFDAIDQLIASGATAKGLKPSGLYPTYEDMINSVASADVGTTFMVGTVAPYALYTWTGSEWTYVGATSPVRGVDFWTPEDVAAINADVKAATDKIDNMTVDAESGDHSDAQISEVNGAKHIHFVLEKGDPGKDGDTPYVGSNGNWYVGDTNTGIKAQGSQGEPGFTPYIGSNGNWFVDVYDTGVKAQGAQGDPGTPGKTPHIDASGNWFVGAVDTGIKAQGDKGDTGDTPNITFMVSTGEAGTDVQVEQSGTVDNPVVHLTIPRGDQGKPGTGSGTVNSVNGVLPDTAGNVTLTIPEQYVLPAAGASVLGGVKVGQNLTIDVNGVLSAQSGLPNGGTIGQVLAKASDKNHDAEWIDPPSGSVTSIKLNDVEHTPDEDGVVDLGSIESGGVNGILVNGLLKEPNESGVVDIGNVLTGGSGLEKTEEIAPAMSISHDGYVFAYFKFSKDPESYVSMTGKYQRSGIVPAFLSGSSTDRYLYLTSVTSLSTGYPIKINYCVLKRQTTYNWRPLYVYELSAASDGGNVTAKKIGSNGTTINIGPIYGTRFV